MTESIAGGRPSLALLFGSSGISPSAWDCQKLAMTIAGRDASWSIGWISNTIAINRIESYEQTHCLSKILGYGTETPVTDLVFQRAPGMILSVFPMEWNLVWRSRMSLPWYDSRRL